MQCHGGKMLVPGGAGGIETYTSGRHRGSKSWTHYFGHLWGAAAEVEAIEAGCTGMAGTWGLQRKNYRNSLRIGWPLISAMRSARVSIATT